MEESPWLTSREVMERWQIDDVALSDFIINRWLPIYSPSTLTVIENYRTFETLFGAMQTGPLERRVKARADTARRVEAPRAGSEEKGPKRRTLLDAMRESLDAVVFLRQDILAFETEHGLFGTKKSPPPVEAPKPARSADTLIGRKEIEEYTRVGWRTVKKWESQEDFPLRTTAAGEPECSKREIDKWLRDRRSLHR